MKILIVGSGGREHALTWACSRSGLKPQITCVPGNGGTVRIARNVPISVDDLSPIADFASAERFDLTIIGPENPLAGGLADMIRDRGLRAFGPSQASAHIESSKTFAKRLMVESGIPTANFAVFNDYDAAYNHILSLGAPVVLKASGLALGKGVIMCRTVEEAIDAAETMLVKGAFGRSGSEIVIEEYLQGAESSLLALVDGEDYLLLPPSRDYKRAFDGDLGPNTGGMGAWAPAVEADRQHVEETAVKVFPPILRALADLDSPFSGCLYAGMINTDAGPKALEFNARFGDPETQAVLPLLNFDLLEAMAAVAEGKLGRWMRDHRLSSTGWQGIASDKHTVTVVIAARGYPGSYSKGIRIESLPPESEDLIIFHAGTKFENGAYYTTGGRVLAVTGVSESHDRACGISYHAASRVAFDGARYRRDIGLSKVEE